MPTASPTCVLVVENDPNWRYILSCHLPRLGYELLGPVSTAAEALALARTGQPAAAVLTIGLDQQPDGVVLASLLQANGPLPIIFLTGELAPATQAEALAAWPANMLVKSFDVRSVVHALKVSLTLALRPAARLASGLGLAPTEWFVPCNGGLQRLPLAKVRYFEADGNYAVAVTARRRYPIRRSLRALARELAPSRFVQSHRRYLLNLRHVTSITSSQTEVCFGELRLPLSRSFHDALLACLHLVR